MTKTAKTAPTVKAPTAPTADRKPVVQTPTPPAGGRPVAPLSAATVAALTNGTPATPTVTPARAVVVQTPDVLVTAGHKGGQRYTVWGHAVTAVLRAMGANGFTNDMARDALAGLGVHVGGSTVGCQCGAWQSRGVPAPLTADQLGRLRSLADKAAAARTAARAAQWAAAHPDLVKAAPTQDQYHARLVDLPAAAQAAAVQDTPAPTAPQALSRKLARKAAKAAAAK